MNKVGMVHTLNSQNTLARVNVGGGRDKLMLVSAFAIALCTTASISDSLWRALAGFTTGSYDDMLAEIGGGEFFTTFVLFIGVGGIGVPWVIVTAALLDREANAQKQTHQGADGGNANAPNTTDTPKSAKTIKGE
ncbi:hypothetical protein [uncultured Aliiroseovarius sp.]|uniref:hypothetical protein n=1 Tax=uncultured Aliiroseovarius sp. TaxID=1658783 RepID=UPI002599E3D9|nr:hypothetical protein [uncultured Aliiroseovarius sp.]